MDLAVMLLVGAVTGWLARMLVKTDVRMGILASVAVGLAGSLLGFGIARAFGLRAQSAPTSVVIVVVGILTAAWLIGMVRGALALFFSGAPWR
jgi:uncharacterized membrane protein YeaQ/YmgE (transglycosylase-associated protein family)